MHTMDTRLNKATRQSRQGITGIDRDGPILRTHPLPLAFGIEDLQCGYWLAEKKSNRSQVCVTWTVQIADLLVFVYAARSVVHVAEVVFTFGFILMIADELVFVWELEKDGEEAEELLNHFRVTFLYHLAWDHKHVYK